MSKVGAGFTVVARSEGANTICAIENRSQQLYGVQYHPEVDLSEHGETVFRTFCLTLLA